MQTRRRSHGGTSHAPPNNLVNAERLIMVITSPEFTSLKLSSSGKRLDYFFFCLFCSFSYVVAQIRADTRRTSTESWAKYFISTDAGIKSVTKKLFCIVFLCCCFVLFAGFYAIYLFI